MTFHKPTQWQLTPKGTNLLGHSAIPPRYGQVKRHKFRAHIMKQKRIKFRLLLAALPLGVVTPVPSIQDPQ
jgi:hypothetical protein